jgi:hypothetical protein
MKNIALDRKKRVLSNEILLIFQFFTIEEKTIWEALGRLPRREGWSLPVERTPITPPG